MLKLERFAARNLSLAEYNCNWLPSRWLSSRSERRLVSRSRYQFPFRDSIQHGRAFPSACCISQGNGNRFEERCCETAVGYTPSACMSPCAIGSSLWCPIPADQPPRAFLSPSRSPKRALFHCPRNIFTEACAMCRCFSNLLFLQIEEFRPPDEKRFVKRRKKLSKVQRIHSRIERC